MVDIVNWETVQIRMEFILSWMCIYFIVYLFFVIDFTSKSRFWEDKTNCDLKDIEKAWEYNDI